MPHGFVRGQATDGLGEWLVVLIWPFILSTEWERRIIQKASEWVLLFCSPRTPTSLAHWVYRERRGGRGRWRKLLFRGDYRQRGAWRDIPRPCISWATSDFQIKWAQPADQNEIFLIDFPEHLVALQIKSWASHSPVTQGRLGAVGTGPALANMSLMHEARENPALIGLAVLTWFVYEWRANAICKAHRTDKGSNRAGLVSKQASWKRRQSQCRAWNQTERAW